MNLRSRTIDLPRTNGGLVSLSDLGGTHVCTIFYGECSAGAGGVKGRAEAEQFARLFVAAPDLLRALEDVMALALNAAPGITDTPAFLNARQLLVQAGGDQ